MSGARLRATLSFAALLTVVGCQGTLDAGHDVPHGLLPVDERNPILLVNDYWRDNWVGEYAVLLAASGGPPIAGIVVNASSYWGDLSGNVGGWNNLLTAARSSGIKNLPTVTMSAGAPLVEPANGRIGSTTANQSAGGKLIVELSRRLSTPSRPLVVVVGDQLTDVADAYLIDETVVDRVVVVAALGVLASPNTTMSAPNGELDPWADWIVAQRFRYIQVSAFYDQTGDVTAGELTNLPQNPLGSWMASKQPNLFTVTTAADQVAVLAVGIPSFVVAVERASPDITAGFDSTQGPALVPDPAGNVWVVKQIAAPLAASRLWQVLLDPHTYGS